MYLALAYPLIWNLSLSMSRRDPSLCLLCVDPFALAIINVPSAVGWNAQNSLHGHCAQKPMCAVTDMSSFMECVLRRPCVWRTGPAGFTIHWFLGMEGSLLFIVEVSSVRPLIEGAGLESTGRRSNMPWSMSLANVYSPSGVCLLLSCLSHEAWMKGNPPHNPDSPESLSKMHGNSKTLRDVFVRFVLAGLLLWSGDLSWKCQENFEEDARILHLKQTFLAASGRSVGWPHIAWCSKRLLQRAETVMRYENSGWNLHWGTSPSASQDHITWRIPEVSCWALSCSRRVTREKAMGGSLAPHHETPDEETLSHQISSWTNRFRLASWLVVAQGIPPMKNLSTLFQLGRTPKGPGGVLGTFWNHFWLLNP